MSFEIEAAAPPLDRLPAFSVVIPTCHRNDLLALCLERLAPGVQSLPAERYEVVVTDDGSQSSAREMISEKFPWARWVAGPQRGPAANRNSGIQSARAEWVVFTDDDCLPEPDWLELYTRALTPNVPVYEGRTTTTRPLKPFVEEAPVNLEGNCLWSCNMMVSKRDFEEIGGFDEEFPYANQEDVDFRERAKASGRTILFVEQAVVAHPPRPIRFGWRRGQVRECEVIVWYKAGISVPVADRLLGSVLKSRLKLIFTTPLSTGTFVGLASVWGEWLYVARHVRDWDKKYAERYRGKPAAYPCPFPFAPR